MKKEEGKKREWVFSGKFSIFCFIFGLISSLFWTFKSIDAIFLYSIDIPLWGWGVLILLYITTIFCLAVLANICYNAKVSGSRKNSEDA